VSSLAGVKVNRLEFLQTLKCLRGKSKQYILESKNVRPVRNRLIQYLMNINSIIRTLPYFYRSPRVTFRNTFYTLSFCNTLEIVLPEAVMGQDCIFHKKHINVGIVTLLWTSNFVR